MDDNGCVRDVNGTIEVLFEISNAVAITDDLDDLYASIHSSLSKILNLENFAIAIYHKEKDSMTFPYFVDENDTQLGEIFEISKKQSLSARVINAGKPLMFYEEDIMQMPNREGRIASHSLCKVWAGAPLKIKGQSFGALLVQSYRSKDAFKKSDLNLLNSVADFIAVSIDRKRIQMARQKSEARYRLLADSVSDVVWTRDLELNPTYISPSIEAQSGFSVEEKLAQSLSQSLPRDSVEKITRILREEIKREREGTADPDRSIVIQIDSYRKDGTIYPVESVISFMRDSTGKAIGVVGINRDITERNRIENELRIRDEKLSSLSSQTEQLSLTAASMISIKDEQLFFDKISKAIVDYSDFKRVIISLFKETTPFRDIIAFDGVEPELVDKLRKVEMPKTWYDKVFIPENSVGLHSYYIPHTKKNILNPDATIYSDGFVSEHENSWHPEDNLFVRMSDDQGNTIGVISVDDSKSGLKPSPETLRPLEIFSSLISQIVILKKEQKEKKNMEIQLRQAQKMEAIGTLAGGVAHDFNNILSPLLGYTEILKTDLPSDSPFQENISKIYQAGLRAKDLVSQILTFSRQDEQQFLPLKIQLILKEALKLLRSSIPKTIEIRENISRDCDKVIADPTAIHQIVMNLATNAYHAMKDTGGIMSVSLEQVALASNTNSVLLPGEYVILTISDTGTGIENHNIENIFNPFFTTKPQGEGTGLGLSVVHGIVKSMNGEIKFKSEPGNGTTCIVYLPVAPNAFDKQSPLTDESIPKGTERILLVDDEGIVLEIGKRKLQRLGYDVTAHAGSIEALEAFRINPDVFDLVITDMTMPNMTGTRLAAELIKIRPDIPILICTGYSEDISEANIGLLGIKGFLEKPMETKRLAKKIRDILDII